MSILYVTREDGQLCRRGDALYWSASPDEPLPTAQIEGVVVIGQGGVTTPALHLLMTLDVPVHYLSGGGQYLGSLTTGLRRSGSVRRAQYAAAGDRMRMLETGRQIITAKIANQQGTLRHYQHRHAEDEKKLRDCCAELDELAARARECDAVDELRGVEGRAANRYFEAFSLLIREPWSFAGRQRRPPKDCVNAMLSFGYALLLGRVTSAALMAGLDPCLGVVHAEYRRRPSLALDLMEAFRTSLIDRLVLRICRQNLLSPAQFRFEDDGGVFMDGEGRQRFLREFSERLKANVRDASSGRKTSFERHIDAQAKTFAAAMKGNGTFAAFVLGR